MSALTLEGIRERGGGGGGQIDFKFFGFKILFFDRLHNGFGTTVHTICELIKKV